MFRTGHLLRLIICSGIILLCHCLTPHTSRTDGLEAKSRSKKSVHPEGPSFVSLPSASSPSSSPASSSSSSSSASFTSGSKAQQLDFYNSSGLILDCRARGTPSPQITWIKGNADLHHVHGDLREALALDELPGLRQLRADGSLHLLPFDGDRYRQDVHTTAYRCLASNSAGVIISGEIRVRAVMKQSFTVQTSDEFAVVGNALALVCNVPAFVRDHVTVVSWQRSDGLVFDRRSDLQGHIRLLTDGSLFMERVEPEDFQWKYRCSTRDELSGETATSATWAKLIRSDANAKAAPRIVSPNKEYTLEAGSNVHLGCFAQAFPVPSYAWFREESQRHGTTSRESLLSSSQPLDRDHGPGSDGQSAIRYFHSHRPLLSLMNLQAKDSGLYVCAANNSLGEDRKWFKITVTESLTLAMRPERLLRAREGDTASIECLVKNDLINSDYSPQRLSFEWLKDGRPFVFGARTKLITRNKLKIASLQRSDRGMYQVVVTKEGPGSATRQTATAYVQLVLQEEQPEFRETFIARTVQPGFGLNLKCAAYGSPLPQIRWFAYNKQLGDSLSSVGRKNYRIADYVDEQGTIISHLNISSLSTHDGALYSCEAVNELGSRRHSALIQVYGPPLVQPMDNVSIISSGNLQTDCPVSGFPIEAIIWSKDGKELPPSRRLKSFPNGTLGIIDAHLEDEGWYRCDVKNKDGQQASGKLYVDVVEKPVINPFLFGPDLREGMRTTVVCSVLSGETPLAISWFKDGRPLQSVHADAEMVRLGDFTASLKLKNIQRKHAGNYTCKASHANIPHVYSTYTALMQVQASPKWVLKPEPRNLVLRGRRVIIDCQAEGIPPPIHQWKKRLSEGQSGQTSSGLPNEFTAIVSGPRLHVLENGSLAIVDANKSDEGEFVCEANNGVGNAISARTHVQVNTAAHFVKNFEAQNAKQGHRVELSCDVQGDPPISVIWTKDREPIKATKYIQEERITESALLSRIFLQTADISDSAFFTCSASNPFGSEERNIQLIVQGAPEPPFNVKASDIKSRGLTLSWSEPNNGNSPLLGFLVQFTRSNVSWNRDTDGVSTSAKDLQAKVNGLLPDTHYKARVFAQNALGDSPPSQEFFFKTDLEAPSEVPSHVQAEAKSATSIWIQFKSPQLASNQISGYYVGYKELSDNHLSSIRDSYTFKTVELMELVRERSEKSGRGQDSLQLLLQNLKRNTRYSVVVQAFNKKGSGPSSEEVVAQTMEFDPPARVTPRLLSATRSSITIAWESGITVGVGGRQVEAAPEASPISGYIIAAKSEGTEWEEQRIAGYHASFTLDNLSCGTKYQMTVCPFNKAGRATASDIMVASTLGSAPSAPLIETLLTSNSTFAQLRLNSWTEHQCPITYFVVQYKIHALPDWIMVSNNIIPEQGQIIVSDLIPATWYDIAMTAYSDAGPAEAQYRFATLTLDGATIPPPSAMVDANWDVIFSDPLVVVPVLCTVIVAAVIVIVVAVVAHRSCSGEMMGMAGQSETGMSALESHYSSESSRKCENMTMSSFSAKNEPLIDCYPIHYTTCQLEPKLSSQSHPFGAHLSLDASKRFRSSPSNNGAPANSAAGGNLSQSSTGVVSSDHVYDVPQRPVLQGHEALSPSDQEQESHVNYSVSTFAAELSPTSDPTHYVVNRLIDVPYNYGDGKPGEQGHSSFLCHQMLEKQLPAPNSLCPSS